MVAQTCMQLPYRQIGAFDESTHFIINIVRIPTCIYGGLHATGWDNHPSKEQCDFRLRLLGMSFGWGNYWHKDLSGRTTIGRGEALTWCCLHDHGERHSHF